MHPGVGDGRAGTAVGVVVGATGVGLGGIEVAVGSAGVGDGGTAVSVGSIVGEGTSVGVSTTNGVYVG